MAAQFLDPAVHPELGINIAEQPTPDSGELAPEVKVHAQTVPAQTERRDEIKMTTSSNPLCTTCGTLMVKTGSCYTCPVCGTSGGCG
jgi:ribonucleoside-diphosphate reductase alpha chain